MGSRSSSTQKTKSRQRVTPTLPSYLQGPVTDYFGQVGGMVNQNPNGIQIGPNTNQTSAWNAAGSLSNPNAQIDALRGFTPDNVTAGQLRDTDLSSYMNPWTDNVVQNSLREIDRMRAGAIAQNQGAATQARAYGGSRHGIADAETNRNAFDIAGNTAGQLYSQGFQNAQAAAFQDIINRMNADTGNANRGLEGANFRLNANMQGDANTRQNLTTQAGLGADERSVAEQNDPTMARMRYLDMLRQLLGLQGSDLIGADTVGRGSQTGTTSSSGFSFGFGPNGLSFGIG